MLSKKSLLMNAQGAAFAHNLFTGKIDVVAYDSRLTPYLKPHATGIAALKDNPGGDVQFVNNIFVKGADISDYSNAYLPVLLNGNVYLKGSVGISTHKNNARMGEVHTDAEQRMKAYTSKGAVEKNALIDTNEVTAANLVEKQGRVYLDFPFRTKWLQQKRALVTSRSLQPTVISNLPFDDRNGQHLQIDRDFFGKPRKHTNPAPGPFEYTGKKEEKITLIYE